MATRCLAALFATALAGALFAQTKELPRVTVKCVDADGAPIANVEVHLFQHRKSPFGPADYVASGPHRTDANGVAVTAIALDYDGGRFDRWFHARVPGRLVGALRWLRFDDAPPSEPVIRMDPSRDVRGVVRVPDGVQPSSVRVRTLSVYLLDAGGSLGAPLPRVDSLVQLGRTLPALFDAEVGTDGAFVLHDMPTRALIYLAAEGPGLAQAQWFNAMLPERRIPDLVELAMEREAVIEGTVLDARGGPIADTMVEIQPLSGGASIGVRCTFTAQTDAAGRFRIGGLPGTDFSLKAVHATLVMRPRHMALAAAATEKDVRVELEEGVEVRGTVRGLPDRVGVERVGVVAIADDDQQTRLGGANTDPQGRFTLRLPKGPARLYIAGVPRGYRQPDTTLDKLLRIDVQPGDDSLAKMEFELEPAK